MSHWRSVEMEPEETEDIDQRMERLAELEVILLCIAVSASTRWSLIPVAALDAPQKHVAIQETQDGPSGTNPPYIGLPGVLKAPEVCLGAPWHNRGLHRDKQVATA